MNREEKEILKHFSWQEKKQGKVMKDPDVHAKLLWEDYKVESIQDDKSKLCVGKRIYTKLGNFCPVARRSTDSACETSESVKF